MNQSIVYSVYQEMSTLAGGRLTTTGSESRHDTLVGHRRRRVV